MLARIVQAVPRLPSSVSLRYEDGEETTVDFAALIAAGGVYAALADPAVFRQVTIGGGGRFIEWPGELEFCADALRMADEERCVFASWAGVDRRASAPSAHLTR